MSNFFGTSEEAKNEVKSFTAGPDSLTTSIFHKYFTKDKRATFANNDKVIGFENLIAFFDPQFEALEMMKHEILDLDLTSTKILWSMTVSYVLKGDPEHQKITVLAFSRMRLAVGAEGPLIERFQVWIDASPVAARTKEIFGES